MRPRTRQGGDHANKDPGPRELWSSPLVARLVETEVMNLLVDECLSEELTKLAQRRGHAEASSSMAIGRSSPETASIFVARAIDRVPKGSTRVSRSTPASYASTVRQGWTLISSSKCSKRSSTNWIEVRIS